MRQKLIGILSVTILALMLTPLTGAGTQDSRDDRDYAEHDSTVALRCE